MFNYIPDKKAEFEVKKIINFKNEKYLIKWLKYLISKNTWELLVYLEKCKKKINEY